MKKLRGVSLYSILSSEFPVSGGKDVSLSPCAEGGTFHAGDLFPVFRETERGHSVLLVPTVFQVTLVQDNQDAKVAHCGAACLEPHQLSKGLVLLDTHRQRFFGAVLNHTRVVQ